VNLATSNAAAQLELFVQQTGISGGFVEQSLTKIIPQIFVNLDIPKAGAKHEHLLKKGTTWLHLQM
jgi:hypothetical protein